MIIYKKVIQFLTDIKIEHDLSQVVSGKMFARRSISIKKQLDRMRHASYSTARRASAPNPNRNGGDDLLWIFGFAVCTYYFTKY
jgi:hypothetical protein